MYRNTSSPFEIDRMTPSDQESIRSLSARISDSLKALKLPENTTENESAGEKAPNKAYKAELERRGYQENSQEELDWLIEKGHTNVPQINKLKDAFYKNQAGIPLSESDSKLLNKYLGDSLLETQLNYAKNNLQPYYTRFAPIGYKSIEEQLKEGEDMLNILNSTFNNSYLNVRIDNSFEEIIPPTDDIPTPEPTIGQFFQDYATLFYDIPKTGDVNSHEFLIRQSSDYVEGNVINNDIAALLEEINSLRQELFDLEAQRLQDLAKTAEEAVNLGNGENE